MSSPRFPEGVGNVDGVSLASRMYVAGDIPWALQDFGLLPDGQGSGHLTQLEFPGRDEAVRDFKFGVENNVVSLPVLHAAIIYLEGYRSPAEAAARIASATLHVGAAVTAKLLQAGGALFGRSVAGILRGPANLIAAAGDLTEQARRERLVKLTNVARDYVRHKYDIELHDERHMLPFLCLALLEKLLQAHDAGLSVPPSMLEAAKAKYDRNYTLAEATRPNEKNVFGIEKLYRQVESRIGAITNGSHAVRAPAALDSVPW